MRRYNIELTGVSPLLLHKDNILWGERAQAWQKDPANKSLSNPGDDRTPAWLWIGYCYFADGLIVMDVDNIMAMLRDAGKKCPASKGRGSLKAATQSGIIVNEIGWPIVSKKGTISLSDIDLLQDEIDFSVHETTAVDLGFELFVKRAKVGTNKHIRVRPRFDVWSVSGSITVLDETLNTATIETLFALAGRFVGLGDWRPGSPASGRFGMFETQIEEIK